MPVTATAMLERESAFFKANHRQLLEKYRGKVLVIVGEEVKGVYDSEIEAYVGGQREFTLGEFMISERLTDEIERVFSMHAYL